MSRIGLRAAPVAMLALVVGCGSERSASPQPAETFSWCGQPIEFSPPPPRWRREGDNGGGLLGVRFVLSGGLGECITVATYHRLAERDRRQVLTRLLGRRDSLDRRQFLRELSLARARTDDPVSEREAQAAISINAALDRASEAYLSDQPGFMMAALEDAIRAADAYELTLPEILPSLRLVPARMREPDRWRIGVERDTTIAGHPAFASFDTLITPERALLYREVFWVVHRCAFKAIYQGTPQNLPHFERLLGSIRFPGNPGAASP
jgi:hypothetical protein